MHKGSPCAEGGIPPLSVQIPARKYGSFCMRKTARAQNVLSIKPLGNCKIHEVALTFATSLLANCAKDIVLQTFAILSVLQRQLSKEVDGNALNAPGCDGDGEIA